MRYICERAAAIEAAEGGVPQDVEWAIARDLPFPDSVFFLQHRPETTWAAAPSRPPPGPATPTAADGEARLRPGAVRAAQRLQGARHVTDAILAAEVAEAAARAGGAVLMRRAARRRRPGDRLQGRAGEPGDGRRPRVAAGRRGDDPHRLPRPRHRRRGGDGGEPGRRATCGTSTRSTGPPTSPTACRSSACPWRCAAATRRWPGAVYDPLHDEMFVAAARRRGDAERRPDRRVGRRAARPGAGGRAGADRRPGRDPCLRAGSSSG